MNETVEIKDLLDAIKILCNHLDPVEESVFEDGMAELELEEWESKNTTS